jgi:hypothetical protein
VACADAHDTGILFPLLNSVTAKVFSGAPLDQCPVVAALAFKVYNGLS